MPDDSRLIRSKTDIETALAKSRAAKGDAEAQLISCGEKRDSALQAGDDKTADSMLRKMEDAARTISTETDRQELLSKALGQAEQLEEEARLEALRSRADKLREIGEELIHRYDGLASEQVSILTKLSAIEAFIESANRSLSGRRVASPNEIRHEPVVEIPERTETIEVREVGAYDGDGRPMSTDIQAPRQVTRTIPADRLGGRQPDPLHLSAFIPAGLWASPAWHGSGKSWHYGPGVMRPNHLRDLDQVLTDLLSEKK